MMLQEQRVAVIFALVSVIRPQADSLIRRRILSAERYSNNKVKLTPQ